MKRKGQMLHPQLIVYESDGSLQRMLRPLARQQKWALREPRRPDSCQDLLRSGTPTVLVIKLDKNVIEEFELLERVHWHYPSASVVLVVDEDDALLANLGWDLGASYVVTARDRRDHLP